MAPESRTDDLDVVAADAEVLPPEIAEAIALSPSRYHAVENLLRTVPQEFRFFQAVRLFERLSPERSPIGRFVAPSREVLRFAAHNSFPFPASQIQTVLWPLRPGELPPTGRKPPPPTNIPVMVVNFMGLTGPSGLLPLYYTEMLVQRLRERDRALASFLDIFNHRMISLFYQAWEKYRFTIAYERGERDRFSHHLMDLIGLGSPGLARRLARKENGEPAVEDDSLLFYSGLLSLQPRSATALQQILWDYFDVPVQVEQFVGAWHRLDEPTQFQFERGNTLSEQLGIGAIVGDEIWDQQSSVRIQLGPLTLEQYRDFLPNGSGWEPLKAMTRFFARSEFDFEVQLVLAKNEVPACELGSSRLGGIALTDEQAPQLGWTSWVKTAPRLEDASDTILQLQ